MNGYGKTWRRKIIGLIMQVVAVTLLLGQVQTFAAEKSSGSSDAEQNVAATEVLNKMSEYLSGLSTFSVTIRSSYDSLQPDGQRIEFGELRNILVQRPNRMSAEVLRSDGDLDLLLFDGQTLTAFKSADNVYARVDHPGTVDAAIVYLVRDLQIRFPLARLWLTTLPEQLKQHVESVSYVEVNQLYEVPVDQLAARTADVDFQVWVDQGDKPLPRRVVITYKNDPGQPQFRADFFDWDLAPKITAEAFTLTPPKGAEEILFLAPVKQEGGKP